MHRKNIVIFHEETTSGLMMINRIVMLCGGVLAIGLSYGGLQVRAAQDQPQVKLYSVAQAKRGADLYQSHQCAMCHGANLDGQGPIPALKGDTFVGKYSGQPITALYDKVQKQMPPTSPGSLTAAESADLVAYILTTNKYAAGDAELPADHDKLATIQMPKH